LFVVGWLASILGLAVAVAGALAGSTLLVYVVGPGLLSLGLIAAAGNQAFERRARGAAYPGPSPILVFAATVAVTYFVGALLGALLDVLVRSSGATIWPPLGQLIGGALTAFVFIGLIRLTVVGTGALSWAEMGVRRFDRQAMSDLAAGASLALPVIGATLIVGVILVRIFGVVSPSPLPPTGELSGLVVQLIAGAVVAPIAEELLFRGFAVTAWRRSIGGNRAILRAAVLFALAHVVGVEADSFGQAIGLIIVGAGTRLPVAWVLGWVFVRRGSIWAPIGLHATFNGVLLVLAHLAIGAGPG
jgi:membrane protease YdiL (CAAX protease family)